MLLNSYIRFILKDIEVEFLLESVLDKFHNRFLSILRQWKEMETLGLKKYSMYCNGIWLQLQCVEALCNSLFCGNLLHVFAKA